MKAILTAEEIGEIALSIGDKMAEIDNANGSSDSSMCSGRPYEFVANLIESLNEQYGYPKNGGFWEEYDHGYYNERNFPEEEE